MVSYPVITLKPGKEKSVLQGHLWIFSGAVHSKPDELTEGDIVQVHSANGQFLGVGHYYPGSIMIRMLTSKPQYINLSFWQEKIHQAYRVRKYLGIVDKPNTNAYRLIHAEGDNIPGLIVDVYANNIVLQIQLKGTAKHTSDIVEVLRNIYPDVESIYVMYSYEEGKNEYLLGQTKQDKTIIQENGHLFYVDWENGQKTGFFIDQRENRKWIAEYCQNKNVLNAFSYSGAFSVYALRAGANLVHSVDSAKKAITTCEANIELNFGKTDKHQAVLADCFDYLKTIDDQYDVIILDPPAFAKHLHSVKKACMGYKQINLQAMRRIRKEGILATFSCSQVIDKELFRKIIFSAAVDSGRKVQIIHQCTQPADHPVNIYHPESEYLKGLILYVE
ncbi:MAG: class I SAM-dependent rRNA methyltransferase [Bacteroidia bacterium]|nr:class I SAM-dependent rRNA methyltransferase [Bacteroidia bacterium]MDW8346639.1 class I SAM-dependent rRNA methyltransferase [Bacteroidia bacterium]